jgi:two-component SAPR family response regulator
VGSLVLDECDRAAAADFDAFVPELLASFTHGRVYVVSRLVPACTVSDETVRAVARFIPADEVVLVWDYAARDQSTVLLEVRAFGSGRVLVNGRVVDSWDGLLPRSLFFYLVDRGMTTRNDIFMTFWPNLSVREATNVFHVTKRKINEVLGTDLTMYWSGFYRIAPNIQLSYDAVQLSELVQNSAIETSERAGELLAQAIALYRGNFLTSLASDWIKKRREELLQTYVEALISLARARERANAPNEALGLYLRAAAIMPEREDLASSIMSLYRSLGMPSDALAIYARWSAS